MRDKTLDLMLDWGLDIVEVTQGLNGYPQGLYKAIKGFDCFEDAVNFANEIGGDVVCLSRRDGHQLWSNNGRAFEGLRRDRFFDESQYEMFTDEGRFEDWCCDEVDNIMQGGFNLFDMKGTLEQMCETYDEIWKMNSSEMALVDKSDYTCEIVDKFVTEIHDDDVTSYAIAVIEKED